MAISLKLFLSGRHFLKDCRRKCIKTLFVAIFYGSTDTGEKGLCPQLSTGEQA